MFSWKRPQDMPTSEPTEEQIWAIIEAHDPHYSAPIRDRLSWHQEMLEGRNMYGRTFTRSSRMAPFDSELPSGHNPTDWVINLNLRHSHDVPLEKVADRLSIGDQEVLQPVADSALPAGVVRLLGYHILHRQAEDWDSRSVLGTPLAAVSGYTDWARYHLRTHYSNLKKAGVYRAIYASIFDYSRLPFAWIRGIAEHWDKATNTCWVGPHELTITLADMQDITGLPILGTPYEECIPPDQELFQRQEAEQHRRGSFVYHDSLHRALAHYQRFFEGKKGGRRCRGAVTLDTWSESFLHRSICSARYARLGDPFDIGTQSSETSFTRRFEPEGGISARHVLARDIDEEVSLVAFIATWLCYFIFPARNRLFRPSTLLMASLIARGERVALAPAALAYLYHGLGRVGAMTSARRYDVEAPWHYLHGWIHEHISGGFSCPETPQYFTEQRYPLIMQLSKATAAVDIVQIRTFLFAPSRMTDRFQIIHQSQLLNLQNQNTDCYWKDIITEEGTPLLLSNAGYRSTAEYLIGIRPSWLCYRRHESIVLEGYNPNRVARQYGFTQATPLYGLPQVPDITDTRSIEVLPLHVRLITASETWAFLLRLGTGSRFYIASRRASTGVSHLWLMWIRHTFASFLEMGFRVYSRKLREPKQTRPPPHIGETSNDRSSGRKRHRESSLTQEERRTIDPLEHGRKRREDTSPPAHQSPIQDEPSPINIEPNRERSSPNNCDEVPVNMSEGTRHSPPVLNEEPPLESVEEEVIPTPVADTSDVSPIRYPFEPSASESVEEFNTISATGESSQSGSTYRTTSSVPEEPLITPAAETEERSSLNSEIIPEPTLRLEVSQFISGILTRSAIFPQGRVVKNLSHIVAALQGLILEVNTEALPELKSFRAEANSLLDCAAITGLGAEQLQQWEATLRDMEFEIFSMRSAQENMPPETTEYAEAKFNAVSEEATTAYDRLQFKLGIMKLCQREIAQANIATFHISSELRDLQYRRQYLIQRRDMIKRDVAAMEEDCERIEAQVSELEQTSSSLAHRQEDASQRLRYVREEYGFMAARAQAAATRIKEIQAKHMQ